MSTFTRSRSSLPPPKLPVRAVTEARVKALLAEVDRAPDAARKALLLYEVGALTEFALHEPERAAERYRSAHRTDSSFRVPRLALKRLAHAQGAVHELLRLLDVDIAAARTDGERTQALVSKAALLEDRTGRSVEARHVLRQALTSDPNSALGALMLEHHLASIAPASRKRSSRDEEWVAAVVQRIACSADPTLRAVLQLELAETRAAGGAIDEALALCESAAAHPGVAWRAWAAQATLARAADRPHMQVAALNRLAALAQRAPHDSEARAACELTQGSASPTQDHSVALHAEAARIALEVLDEPAVAVASLEEALASEPEDPWLHHLNLEASERSGDFERARRSLRQLGVRPDVSTDLSHKETTSVGRAWTALREAELAEALGDHPAVRSALEHAWQAAPTSGTALALLEDRWLDESDITALIACLETRAHALRGQARAEALWRAGLLAADRSGDLTRARPLLESAAEAAVDKVPVLRELYGVALRWHEHALARDAGAALAAATPDAAERSALMRERYHLLLGEFQEPTSALALLSTALDDEACQDWAPDTARLVAALSRDNLLLARAHRKLATRSEDDAQALAHLCAAARAALCSGDVDTARRDVDAALDRAPHAPYAWALHCAGELRAGRFSQALQAVKSAPDAAGLALQLGAAAENAGAWVEAAQAYQSACNSHTDDLLAPWALWRLALRQRVLPGGDDQSPSVAQRARWLATALEQLSRYEQRAPGATRRFTFEHGARLLAAARTTVETARAQQELERVLEDPTWRLCAAWQLAGVRGDHALEHPRRQALHYLRTEADDASVQGALTRELMSLDLDAPQRPAARELVAPLAADVCGAAYGIWLAALAAPDETSRADAWTRLARWMRAEHPDAVERWTETGLQALRLGGEGLEAWRAAAADHPCAALALEEALSAPGQDPAAYIEALQSCLAFGDDPAWAYAGFVQDLGAVHARAQVRQGQHLEACDALRERVDHMPDDLASWEALRVAARHAQDWPSVVNACDALAEHAEGTWRAELLEEAGVTLEEELEEVEAAEERYRQALETDPQRSFAFTHLHDLLAQRGDTVALAELLEARLAVEDAPAALVELYYEQARLLRATGQRDRALGSLANLHMLDEHHLGALGLSAEIHLSLERWPEAVAALRSLATAGVPPAQQRLARLGAADILDRQLNDLQGALQELEQLNEAGLADAQSHAQRATLFQRLDAFPAAIQAFGDAASASHGSDAAYYHRQAASLLRDHDAGRAAAALEAALRADPRDVAACQELCTVATEAASAPWVEACTRALHDALAQTPTDLNLLRKLRTLAEHRGLPALAHAALAVQVVLETADDEERQAYARWSPRNARMAGPALPTSLLAQLLTHGSMASDAVNFTAFARDVDVAAAHTDAWQPARFGVQRQHRVGEEHPLYASIQGVTRRFGVNPTHLYVGGDDPYRIVAWPEPDGDSVWVIGAGWQAALPASARFRIGWLAMGLLRGFACLAERPLAQMVQYLNAAYAETKQRPHAATPMAVPAPDPDLMRRLRKNLPRRLRKQLDVTASEVPGAPVSFARFAAAELQNLLRAGLVASNDLPHALQVLALADEAGPTVQGARPGERVADPKENLLAFWLSETMQMARVHMGYEP